MIEFQKFPKIPRLMREMVITEKIDGTNGCVVVTETGEVFAQSRNRFVSRGQDNAGFGAWVEDNEQALREILGPGHHFGEWWGQGIQRRYGLDHKRFSLFNPARWAGMNELGGTLQVVPVLHEGPFDTSMCQHVLRELVERGSTAAPGFMNPEGIIVFHTHSRQVFKLTVDDDHKGV